MATMTIYVPPPCQTSDCNARATRSVVRSSGAQEGVYCARHANIRLVELAKEEGRIAGIAATPYRDAAKGKA